MKPLTFGPEFEQYLKDNEGVTALVVYLPQYELGITMTLHPDDVQLMDEDQQSFCERFVVPALANLSSNLAEKQPK